jgi:hypothetical protein
MVGDCYVVLTGGCKRNDSASFACHVKADDCGAGKRHSENPNPVKHDTAAARINMDLT